MRFSSYHIFLLFLYLGITSCASKITRTENSAFKYLALGDSYTIGESVSSDMSFPAQLKRIIEEDVRNCQVDLSIIATTGWTTTDLLSAIKANPFIENYDFVSLLIGVNNQYQGKPFTLYEKEFVNLLDIAIRSVGGNRNFVTVISIPDYAYTPYGQTRLEPTQISSEIDRYNAYAKSVCESKDVTFIQITDITRKGLDDTTLVASDGLHPSGNAYRQFATRIRPFFPVKSSE